MIVHSGSRHLGVEVTEYYLRKGQKLLTAQGLQIPYELTWIEGVLREEYLHDLMLVQEHAALNRKIILKELQKGMKWKVEDSIECVHNYIHFEENDVILRKGAISAHKGENVIIPINMKDGVILGKGLGNTKGNRGYGGSSKNFAARKM